MPRSHTSHNMIQFCRWLFYLLSCDQTKVCYSKIVIHSGLWTQIDTSRSHIEIRIEIRTCTYIVFYDWYTLTEVLALGTACASSSWGIKFLLLHRICVWLLRIHVNNPDTVAIFDWRNQANVHNFLSISRFQFKSALFFGYIVHIIVANQLAKDIANVALWMNLVNHSHW